MDNSRRDFLKVILAGGISIPTFSIAGSFLLIAIIDSEISDLWFRLITTLCESEFWLMHSLHYHVCMTSCFTPWLSMMCLYAWLIEPCWNSSITHSSFFIHKCDEFIENDLSFVPDSLLFVVITERIVLKMNRKL